MASDGSSSAESPDEGQAQRRPFLSYSRMTLLALYKSPLVPHRLEGMKELSEWYGEFNQPPASPPTRARDIHHAGSRHNSHSINNATSPSSHSSSRSNPFANFGRFGVDGGLEGSDAIGSAGKFASLAQLGHSNVLEKRRGGQHTEIAGGRTKAEAGRPGAEQGKHFTNERDRGERIKARSDGLGSGTKERRDENGRKDRRTDEGGWRTAPGPNDRRAGRGEYQAASNSRETRRDRDAGDSRGTGRSSRPAWMNDDAQPSGSAPAWMDEPTGGIVSFDGGRVLDKPEATDGMDSIQAWKKQMKDMERRGKGLGLEETVNKSGPVASEGPASSVFANLVRKPEVNHAEPGHAADSAGNSVASQGKEGGRASRFAKFFDGKPAPAPASPPPQQSPTPQAQPPQSIFETLLGGSSANKPSSSPGPSKEDSESMARLLGMLQMSSGARTGSPANVGASVASPTLQSPPAETGKSSERTSSRFKFTQSPVSHDPASSAPAQSINQTLQAFGLPQLGSNEKSDSKQAASTSHSPSGSAFNAPPPNPGPPLMSPPHLGQTGHANPLFGPHSAASHPLPPSTQATGHPDHSRQMPPSSMGPHPPSMPPNARSMAPAAFQSPPPELPPHLRGMPIPSGHFPLPPPQSQPPGSQGPPAPSHGRPPMPQGSAPPFMMYPGPPPPPGMFGGMPPPPPFRGMPPPPPGAPPMGMPALPFNGQGVPDLMALLNSGGGGLRNGPVPSAPRQ